MVNISCLYLNQFRLGSLARGPFNFPERTLGGGSFGLSGLWFSKSDSDGAEAVALSWLTTDDNDS
jgi:hypothetical protein